MRTETPRRLTLALASRMILQAVRDKSYRASPIGQLVGRYIRWARNEGGFTPSSIRDYESILARMALHLGDLEPPMVTIDELRDVIDLWADREPKTRAKVTSVIRAFWTWAEEEGYAPVSPAARLRRPKVPRKTARPLPGATDTRIVAAATVARDRVALAFLIDYGLRRGELAGIQPRDIDLSARTITVMGKGRKERVLPLRGRIVVELERYMLEPLPHPVSRQPEPDDYLIYPEKRGGDGTPWWADPKKPMAPNSVHRWWYRMLRQAGLVGTGVTAGLNMHRARHSFARDMRRVAGIDAASQALGHSDLSTTLGIYGHQDDSDLERAFGAFARKRRREVRDEES